MHLVVAEGQVEGPRELPQVQAAQEEEDGENGVGQQPVNLPYVMVAGHRADDALPRPGRHSPEHGGQRRAQQNEHRGDHPQDEVLHLVEGKQMVRYRVQRRLEGEENQEQPEQKGRLLPVVHRMAGTVPVVQPVEVDIGG